MPPVSKIAQMPAEIRERLHRTLVEHGFGNIEAITEQVNAWLVAEGIDFKIGKSAIGVESQKVKRAQESIAVATRHMQLIADSAPDDADKRGEALNALVSEGLFQALLFAREAEAEDDPAARISLMNKAALASARLSVSSVRQRKFRQEVEERAKTAAAAVTKIAKTGGLTPAQVSEIRSQILGITKRPQGAP